MLDGQLIESVIFDALHSLNEELPEEEKVEITSSTNLFGMDSDIDSLSLVSVIVDIETELNSQHNLEISLTDDRAMTREVSPFTNVQSLKSYILELVEEKQ